MKINVTALRDNGYKIATIVLLLSLVITWILINTGYFDKTIIQEATPKVVKEIDKKPVVIKEPIIDVQVPKEASPAKVDVYKIIDKTKPIYNITINNNAPKAIVKNIPNTITRKVPKVKNRDEEIQMGVLSDLEDLYEELK